MLSDMLSYLLARETEMEQTLITLMQAESPSTDKSLVDQCGQVLQAEFTRLVGGSVTRISQTHTGDCYRCTYGEGDEQILIIGHFDTVWDQGALSIEKRDGILYGPGAFDMKGGLTVALYAIHALAANHVTGNRKVVFLATSDEEIGSHASRELIEAEAKKVFVSLSQNQAFHQTVTSRQRAKASQILLLPSKAFPLMPDTIQELAQTPSKN